MLGRPTVVVGTHWYRLTGFSLAEMLVVVMVVAVLATVALPSGAPNSQQKLDLVAEEVTEALRLAVAEARRQQGAYILVDGKNQVGALRLYVSNSQAQLPPTALTSELADPVTKRSHVVDPSARTLSRGVVITPQFFVGSQAWGQLLIGPTPSQFTAFNGTGSANSKGSLGSGSGVLVAVGTQTTFVSFNHLTGYVTRP